MIGHIYTHYIHNKAKACESFDFSYQIIFAT